MTDITLVNVSSGYNLSNVNSNFETIEEAINSDIVHLEGGNNVMRQSLDMNSQRLLNLPQPASANEPARLADLQSVISDGIDDAFLINYTSAGTGAEERTVKGDLDDLSVNVKRFGAEGDGVNDDTAEIALAIAFAVLTGRKVYFPAGTYLISDTLTVNTGVYTTGIILYGEGRNSIIRQTGTNKDAIHFSTTQFLQNSGLRDLKIVCDSDAGHCINIVYGCTTCFIENVDLEQDNPSKSLIYGNYTSFGGGIYDTRFSGGSWYCNPATTRPGVDFTINGSLFNENIFENLRCYQSNVLQFFYISTTTTASIWLVNNTFRNLNFEVCVGGGIFFDSFKNCSFQNLSFWDAGGTYDNHLIEMGSGVGYESISNTFINVGRNGDSLGSGVRDIRIVAGQDTTLINCYTQSADTPVYDFNSKRVTIIGPFSGTINNGSATFKLGNQFGHIQFPDTQNGAFLDYYDEGTWTAVLSGSGAGPTTPVSVTGYWTRVGRLVSVTARMLNVNTTGASGDVIVTGLPFTVGATTSYGPATIANMGSDMVVAAPVTGTTQLYFYLATNSAALLSHSAGAGRYLAFTASYQV